MAIQVNKRIKRNVNRSSATISNNGAFRLIISCKLDGVNEVNLELDTCTSKSVRASSTIASQPLQGGYVMSDHMYRNPDEFSVSGKFSLNGYIPSIAKNDNDYLFTNISSASDRLTRIQEVFEYIKNYGILCDLTTLSTDPTNPDGIRFKTRTNMALQSIEWREYQNCMDYTFSFKEVITVEVEHYEGIPYKDNNPNTEANRIMTLGELLKQYRDIPSMVIESLIDNGLIDTKDLRLMLYMGNDALPKVLQLVVEVFRRMDAYNDVKYKPLGTSSRYYYDNGTVEVDDNGKMIISSGNTPKQVIKSTCTFLFSGIISLKSSKSNKFNFIVDKDAFFTGDILQIAGIKDVKIYYPDVTRLEELLNTMNDKVSQLFNDTLIYTISGSIEDNENRTLQLSLDDTYYYFKFNRDNTNDNWHLSVLDENKDALTSGKYGTAINTDGWCVISHLYNARRYENSLFLSRTANYEVYLYNPNYDEYINGDQDAIDEVTKYLYGYYIVVSKGNMQLKINNLTRELNNLLGELGYN